MGYNKIVSWIWWTNATSDKYPGNMDFSNSALSIGSWWIASRFLSVMGDRVSRKLIGMGNRIIVWDKPNIECACCGVRVVYSMRRGIMTVKVGL